MGWLTTFEPGGGAQSARLSPHWLLLLDGDRGLCDQRSLKTCLANHGAVMASDSKVTLPDVYNVVRSSCCDSARPSMSRRTWLLRGEEKIDRSGAQSWYQAEPEERAPITAVVEKAKKRERRSKV